jgi:cell division inhibitor SulA
MDQLGMHDGAESVEGIWIRPQQALDDADNGRRTLVNATRMNLQKLARSATVNDAVLAARSSRVVTVLPQVETLPDGSRRIRIPEDAGYGQSLVHVPKHIRPASGG